MTDFLLLEKINQLNSSTVKPRLLYQRGVVARGTFRPYMSLSDYTEACFLQDPDVETPVAVRFSRAAGAAGSAESLRDIRGFSVRFKTTRGDYDLLSHNMPVYYIKDPGKFPELIQTFLPSGEGFRDSKEFWRFLARNPEAVNIAMWLYSDRGTVKTYRFMDGYSMGTSKWVNRQGEAYYVRYRWLPICKGEEEDERRKGISYQEAEFLAGFEADCCTRDLFEAIEEERFPCYDLEVQIMEKSQAAICGFDPLAETLLWPESQFPYLKIGKMTLIEKGTEQDNERLCLIPSNTIRGVELSDSPLLKVVDYACKDSGRQRGVL